MIHLSLLVRQLTCAEAGILVDNYRWFYLAVTGLFAFVKKEVYQCPLESGTLALINGETGAGYLYSEIKVNDVIFLDKVPVRDCSVMQFRNDAAAADHGVFFGAPARSYQGVRKVGQPYQLILHPAGHILKGVSKLLLLLLHGTNATAGCLSFILPPFLHHCPYLT